MQVCILFSYNLHLNIGLFKAESYTRVKNFCSTSVSGFKAVGKNIFMDRFDLTLLVLVNDLSRLISGRLFSFTYSTEIGFAYH